MLVRDAAFLPVTESIAGFEVTQMTLLQWGILRVAQNPLLYGGTPSPLELSQFLWVLNPGWNVAGRGRRSFLKACRKRFMMPVRPWLKTPWAMKRWRRLAAAKLWQAREVIGACRRYLDETFQDRPPSNPNLKGFQPSYYSDLAYFCGVIASKFPQDDATILRKPVKQVFQLLRIIDQMNGSEVPLGNRSDGIVCDFLAKENAKLRKAKN